MGQRLARPFRNFNIENRAAKVLERQQEAPKAAPKHATTVDPYAQIQESPEILADLESKHERLNEHLKQIYIDSKDPLPVIKSARMSAQLSRGGPNLASDLDLGVLDLEDGVQVPVGRCSLKGMMGFISDHQVDASGNHTVQAIAAEHNLQETQVQNVLTHFKVMHLHIPKEMYKETKNFNKVLEDQKKTLEKIATKGFRLEEKIGDGVESAKSGAKSIPDGSKT